jgi:hypothetical protein
LPYTVPLTRALEPLESTEPGKVIDSVEDSSAQSSAEKYRNPAEV